ncbi:MULTISPECIES: hypothetical protein [unclassified Pseudomonas]|uniref:hypothetical protein n=1 Tax=unclassified Pseudomonas TaxID=196821 RepID=UPI002AC9F00C|nr:MULTISPECIES: hypothetical protein [unclassified Pseudomonas]MEB0043539.1 hypothetical protein [Pseudomonas sp. MH10]MEB0123332.1 hypothetical protein [Pseudomonas sp. CCI1.2]WPX64487.1 hypothetical protein RHM59_01965 [Pseudomonas sp. MH10]
MATTYENSTSGSDQGDKPGAAEHLQTLQDDAKAALQGAKEHGAAQFEQYRDTAADQINNLAQTAKSAAEQFQENDTLGLSHYVTDIAQGMTSLADNLRGKSADELLRQAGQLARDNPALFLTGSVAVGFGLSRFLKASSSGASSGMGASKTPSPTADTHSGSGYKTEPSTSGMAQGSPTPPPNTDDVYHSARPGVPDSFSPPPLSEKAFGPGHSSEDLPSDGLSKGEV